MRTKGQYTMSLQKCVHGGKPAAMVGDWYTKVWPSTYCKIPWHQTIM